LDAGTESPARAKAGADRVPAPGSAEGGTTMRLELKCEWCGRLLSASPRAAGTTQICQCGAAIDIPAAGRGSAEPRRAATGSVAKLRSCPKCALPVPVEALECPRCRGSLGMGARTLRSEVESDDWEHDTPPLPAPAVRPAAKERAQEPEAKALHPGRVRASRRCDCAITVPPGARHGGRAPPRLPCT